MFHVAEALFDGVKVRRIRWQEQEFCARALDQFFGLQRGMEGGIVQDDHTVCIQLRTKLFLYPGIEDSSITGALEQERCGKFAVAKRSDEAGAGSALSASQAIDAFAFASKAIDTFRGGGKSTFVHIKETLACYMMPIPLFKKALSLFVIAFFISPCFFYD